MLSLHRTGAKDDERVSTASQPTDTPAQDAIRAAMLNAAFGQTAVTIIVCDADFSPCFLNAAARGLFVIHDDVAPGDIAPGWLWEVARIDTKLVSAVIERDGFWRGGRALAALVLGSGRLRETDIEISPFRDASSAGFIIFAREAAPQTLVARRTSDVDVISTSRRLTAREKEVMLGLLEGLSNKAIGLRMKISPRTVEFHRARLMHRFGARSLVELIQKVLHDPDTT